MPTKKFHTVLIGAGAIGTALGNILAEANQEDILLLSIEPEVVESINQTGANAKYFPTLHLEKNLFATLDAGLLAESRIIFLCIPSVVMADYLESIRGYIPGDALLINMAKGFGPGNRTIPEWLTDGFPNPVCTMKGPSFAREIINRLPTGFTLGFTDRLRNDELESKFRGTNIHFDHTDDIRGVELLSILKNIYAVALGIVDAQFNSPNLRFLVLTNAFREMRKALVAFGGREETIFNYCGYGDFTLTALNDLSRNRTLGLLIGKGFFTEHVSHELVLEGKTAVKIFYEQISSTTDAAAEFPILHELYRIFTTRYDFSGFVRTILNLSSHASR